MEYLPPIDGVVYAAYDGGGVATQTRSCQVKVLPPAVTVVVPEAGESDSESWVMAGPERPRLRSALIDVHACARAAWHLT